MCGPDYDRTTLYRAAGCGTRIANSGIPGAPRFGPLLPQLRTKKVPSNLGRFWRFFC